MATQIAHALNVSLDYLVGSTDLLLDKNIIKKNTGNPVTGHRKQKTPVCADGCVPQGL